MGFEDSTNLALPLSPDNGRRGRAELLVLKSILKDQVTRGQGVSVDAFTIHVGISGCEAVWHVASSILCDPGAVGVGCDPGLLRR